MSERMEYRLRWQRVGLRPTSKIFQTEKGAVEKAERMLRLDETKHDDSDPYNPGALADMPDLVWMRMDRRPVGEWADERAFDVSEPDPDSARREDPNAGIDALDGVPF